MHIAHISDTHIVPAGKYLNGTIDVSSRLTQAVERINTLSPKVDAVLVTGDLVEKSNADAYDNLVALLNKLEAPYFLIPGNHDDRDLMQEKFAGSTFFPNKDGFAQYVIDDFPVRLIGLDSIKNGVEIPEFCDKRAEWLRTTLDEQPDRPTLLFIHHPPLKTGIGFHDFVADENWEKNLRDVLANTPQVKLLLCGHVHTHVSGLLGHVPVVSAPGCCFKLSSDIGVDDGPRLIDQPGEVLLHHWTGTSFITTPCAYASDADGPAITDLAGMSWPELKKKWQEK